MTTGFGPLFRGSKFNRHVTAQQELQEKETVSNHSDLSRVNSIVRGGGGPVMHDVGVLCRY